MKLAAVVLALGLGLTPTLADSATAEPPAQSPTTAPQQTYPEKVVAHFPGGRDDFFTLRSAVIVGGNICRGLDASARWLAETNYARLKELIISQAEITAGEAVWLLDTTIVEVCK